MAAVIVLQCASWIGECVSVSISAGKLCKLKHTMLTYQWTTDLLTLLKKYSTDLALHYYNIVGFMMDS